MLVLSRGVHDAIVIDEDIEVTIPRIKGKTVRIGINASAEMDVHRSEVFVRLR